MQFIERRFSIIGMTNEVSGFIVSKSRVSVNYWHNTDKSDRLKNYPRVTFLESKLNDLAMYACLVN